MDVQGQCPARGGLLRPCTFRVVFFGAGDPRHPCKVTPLGQLSGGLEWGWGPFGNVSRCSSYALQRKDHPKTQSDRSHRLGSWACSSAAFGGNGSFLLRGVLWGAARWEAGDLLPGGAGVPLPAEASPPPPPAPPPWAREVSSHHSSSVSTASVPKRPGGSHRSLMATAVPGHHVHCILSPSESLTLVQGPEEGKPSLPLQGASSTVCAHVYPNWCQC